MILSLWHRNWRRSSYRKCHKCRSQRKKSQQSACWNQLKRARPNQVFGTNSPSNYGPTCLICLNVTIKYIFKKWIDKWNLCPLSDTVKPQSQADVKPTVNVSLSEVRPLTAAFKSSTKTDTVVRILSILGLVKHSIKNQLLLVFLERATLYFVF